MGFVLGLGLETAYIKGEPARVKCINSPEVRVIRLEAGYQPVDTIKLDNQLYVIEKPK